MTRIISIDYGLRRVGIAVSDPTRTIAGGLETVPTGEIRAWLKRYVADNQTDTIVIGRPLQMNGMPSEIIPQIDSLIKWLNAEFPAIKIVGQDERFTSVLAHRAMLDGGLGKMARRDKALVDRISAAIILQSYLDTV